MDHSRRILTGFYIFSVVLFFPFLGGCVHWIWDKGNHRDQAKQTEIGDNWQNEAQHGELHGESQDKGDEGNKSE